MSNNQIQQEQQDQQNTAVKKKDVSSIIISITTLLVIIAIVAVGFYGYAKYVSSRSGTATAQIADFHFALKNMEGDSTATAQSGTIEFAITRTDGNSKVATGKLAPETYGRFDMFVDGTGSNVAYRYDINVTVNNCPKNLEFYSDSEHTQLITTTRTPANPQPQDNKTATFTISKYVPLNRVNEEHQETVYWEWKYETGTTDNEILANDLMDSADMEKTVTMTIVAVGSQAQGQPQGIAVVGEHPDKAVANNISINDLTNNTLELRSGQTANVTFGYNGDDTNLETLSVRSNDDQVATATLQNGEIVVTAKSITPATTTVEVYGENSMVTKSFTVSVDGVKAGDIINYNPSGSYAWNNALAQTNGSGTTNLSSASGQTYNVSTWKVLDVDNNGNIEMVPTAAVGSLTLQGAQGYNNAVKLLNDACSSLYGDPSKRIAARSIREEDFVEAGKKSQAGDSELVNDWTRNRANYANNYASYNGQCSSFAKAYSFYPNIYAQENGSVIDGPENLLGYTRSKQDSYIQPVGGGYSQAESNIQPHQTCYATGTYSTTTLNWLEEGCASVLLPNTDSTNYWVASRCVNLGSGKCDFRIYDVKNGRFGGEYVFSSNSTGYQYSSALFPVVTLHADNLETTSTAGTFNVK